MDNCNPVDPIILLDEVVIAQKALAILRLLDGLTVSQTMHVLRHAEEVLGMATRIDCASTPFRQAVAALLPAFAESGELLPVRSQT